MNNASQYCKTLNRVTKAKLVNALHQALMQLNATAKHETLTLVDNRPAIAEASRIMAKAGHLGFPIRETYDREGLAQWLKDSGAGEGNLDPDAYRAVMGDNRVREMGYLS